jgi:hypothetical protein
MSMSEILYVSWQRYCAETLGGRVVDINVIEPNLLSHLVPAGEPPLQTADGAYRKISMAYDNEDLRNEFPN